MFLGHFSVSRFYVRIRRVTQSGQVALSVLAFAVGGGVGGAVIIFRETIALVQEATFGTGRDYYSEPLFAAIDKLPWWQVVAVPSIGGVVVGLLVKYLMPAKCPEGVADVIEAAALQGGRMSGLMGIKAALINAFSIGFGASVGREGPAVHFGAALGGWLAGSLNLNRSVSRTLLG
jgi:CIC family chloride channel protein